jgi:hypothetical protein
MNLVNLQRVETERRSVYVAPRPERKLRLPEDIRPLFASRRTLEASDSRTHARAAGRTHRRRRTPSPLTRCVDVSELSSARASRDSARFRRRAPSLTVDSPPRRPAIDQSSLYRFRVVMALSTRAVTLKASCAPNLRAVRRAGARRAAAITTRCDIARARPSRVARRRRRLRRSVRSRPRRRERERKKSPAAASARPAAAPRAERADAPPPPVPPPAERSSPRPRSRTRCTTPPTARTSRSPRPARRSRTGARRRGKTARRSSSPTTSTRLSSRWR